jgi:hypothetical protein
VLRKAPIVTVLALALLAAGGGAAYAFEVRGTDFILSAGGGISPNALPRRAYAPAQFRGRFEIASKRKAGVPPALEQAVLDFDREGGLDTRGLPTCAVSAVAEATPQEARAICKGAIVGSGQLAATIALPGRAPVKATSPLTLFNGVPEGGDPAVILHARLTSPVTQTFAVVVPIERLHGSYSYRATIDLPPIAGGYGALTQIEAKVGRRYRAGGRQLSYISARCLRGLFEARGKFTASDGNRLTVPFFKSCKVRG